MRALTWDEFAHAAGTVYQVPCGDERFELTLDRAEEVPSAGREGGSFRLEFLGPFEPILPQAIYPFCHGEDAMDIFIVPIGRTSAGTRYEAVFY
jgi:hypothetical protein